MSKLRSVDTHFWNDDYVVNLDPTEKLLFLYLLTNPSTGMSGCYERPLRTIAFDTGIDREMVAKILSRFESHGKIKYKDGWVILFNFNKHNNLNPSMQRAAEKELQAAPGWVREALAQDDNSVLTGCEQDEGNRIELNRIEVEGNEQPLPFLSDEEDPPPLSEDELKYKELLKIFNEFYPEFKPAPLQENEITCLVDNPTVWRATCKDWAMHSYQPRNIKGLLELYARNELEAAQPQQTKLSPTAVVAQDPCPMCTGSQGPASCRVGGKEGKCTWGC